MVRVKKYIIVFLMFVIIGYLLIDSYNTILYLGVHGWGARLETWGMDKWVLSGDVIPLNESMQPYMNTTVVFYLAENGSLVHVDTEDLYTCYAKIVVDVKDNAVTIVFEDNTVPLVRFKRSGTLTYFYNYREDRFEPVGINPFVLTWPNRPETLISQILGLKPNTRFAWIKPEYEYTYVEHYYQRIGNKWKEWMYKDVSSFRDGSIDFTSPEKSKGFIAYPNGTIVPGCVEGFSRKVIVGRRECSHQNMYMMSIFLFNSEYIGSIPHSLSIVVPSKYLSNDFLTIIESKIGEKPAYIYFMDMGLPVKYKDVVSRKSSDMRSIPLPILELIYALPAGFIGLLAYRLFEGRRAESG